MKLVKTLGLAALAVLAVTAFVGASTASAEEKTVLCKVHSGSECTEANIYPKNTKIESESATTVLKTHDVVFGIDGTVSCDESKVIGEITSENGKGQPSLTGKITSLSFTGNCETSLGASCTVETLQLPYEARVQQDTVNQGNGHLIAYETGTNGQPGARVKCNAEGFSPKIDCIYKVNQSNAQVPGKQIGELQVIGGSQPGGPSVEATGASGQDQVGLKEVTFMGSACPGGTPQWEGVYHVTSPTAGWVQHVNQ